MRINQSSVNPGEGENQGPSVVWVEVWGKKESKKRGITDQFINIVPSSESPSGLGN